jgi:hypothetical protein
MNHPPGSPEERYAAVAETLLTRAGVTSSTAEPQARKGFGSSGELKVGGKIFSILTKGRLVVKLPRQRVDELVASGAGERFDPRNDGRLMKEWLALDSNSGMDWLALSTEAME